MKTKILVLLALFIFSIAGCQNDDGDDNYFSSLQGTWINLESDFDALIFQNDTLLQRKNLQTGSINHYYSMKIESDEIVLKYKGRDKIELVFSKHKYYLNTSMDTLVIENLSQYYPKYIGNKFYKFKKE
jgi:hypothetical protein